MLLWLMQGGRNVCRQITTSSFLRQAVPAVVQSPPSGGLLSRLLGDTPSNVLPPLYEPLVGVRHPEPLSDASKASETKLTTLQNGLRIASEDTPVFLHPHLLSLYGRITCIFLRLNLAHCRGLLPLWESMLTVVVFMKLRMIVEPPTCWSEWHSKAPKIGLTSVLFEKWRQLEATLQLRRPGSRWPTPVTPSKLLFRR